MAAVYVPPRSLKAAAVCIPLAGYVTAELEKCAEPEMEMAADYGPPLYPSARPWFFGLKTAAGCIPSADYVTAKLEKCAEP